MTREEAIVVLEESKRQNEVMRENPSTFWSSHQMAEGVKNAEKRIAALDLALTALRGPTKEMVGRMRGEWIDLRECHKDVPKRQCSHCGKVLIGLETSFCEACGAPMTNEAVEMVMERLEMLQNEIE